MNSAGATFWKDQLPNVRWIGGPPDAGKSTVTQLLASQFHLSIYRQDQHERVHIEKADDSRFPLHATLRQQLIDDETGFFEQWVSAPLDVQVAFAHDLWTERLPLICEDLQALPADTLCIAEGPGFFPDIIRPLLHDPHQAIWLIPTPGFKRDSHIRRGKSAWRDRTSNPELALRNHIDRDIRLADLYRGQLQDGDMSIEIDGATSAESIAAQIADWFGLVM